MNWIKRILWKIKSLFTKSEPVQPQGEKLPQQEQSPPPVADLPSEQPPAPTPADSIGYADWCRRAMPVSGQFEGKGEDWANVVGNFDGAGLTCGLLGFTWKWNNQSPMLLEFIKRHGEERFMALMPAYGRDYRDAARAGERGGWSTVTSWTTSGEKVRADVKKELSALWDSPEMRQIQIEKAHVMMGVYAKKRCEEVAAAFDTKPDFGVYCYFFDEAVLNGTGKPIAIVYPTVDQLNKVIDFCASVGGYNTTSIRPCGKLWKEQLKRAKPSQKALLYMAYLRALKSRSKFMGTTLMRRGTLALGIGVVNESTFKFSWRE